MTNYKPWKEMLRTERSWRWMPQVPSSASIVIVQDQTSAQNAANKNKKARRREKCRTPTI